MLNDPTKLYPSQLNELCRALGWQGGTFYQVVQEVKRLRRLVEEAQLRDAPGVPCMSKAQQEDAQTRAYIAEIAAEPRRARAFLQDAGILDERGELAEPFRAADAGVSRLDSEVKRTPAPLVSGDSEANKEKG